MQGVRVQCTYRVRKYRVRAQYANAMACKVREHSVRTVHMQSVRNLTMARAQCFSSRIS